jgi:hypothetical protein
MPREDYIIRHIQMVGPFIAQIVNARRAGQEDQAIQIAMQAVEKLFGLRMDEISSYSLEAQLDHLAKGLSRNEARGRQFAYALLLKELGLSYRYRDRSDVSVSSFNAALWIALRLLVENESADGAVAELAREMLSCVPPELLDEPLKELLALAPIR